MRAPEPVPPPFVLTGPTGTGKTAVSLELAALLEGAVVCADSRQLYRGLDVATGKPSPAERARAPHLGFDALEIAERSTAGAYARTARPILESLASARRSALLVGGSGFYLRALHQGLAAVPDVPDDVRQAVALRLESKGPEALHAELALLDPMLARRLGPRDGQRVGRGLEVVLATGRPLSAWQEENPDPAPAWFWVALTRSRSDHAQALEARAHGFFEQGLVEETRGLLQAGIPEDAPGFDTLGYREALDVLAGRLELDDARALVARRTIQYAKRQMTWLRGEARRVNLVFRDIGPHESPGQIAHELAERYRAFLRGSTARGNLAPASAAESSSRLSG